MTQRWREWAISNPEEFLKQLAQALGYGRLRRRRALSEIRQHIEDSVADLRAGGLGEIAAIEEALRRIGDPETVAAAFRSAPAGRRGACLLRPAWIAAAAMSAITVWAAEVPQSSGAKAPSIPAFAAHPHNPVHAGPRDRPRHENASASGSRLSSLRGR